MTADPSRILADVFGFRAFRPGQREIVDAVLQGRNVLAIMPTGGGKSLCYQLPALCRSGVTLVISPLIALMRDQVRALRDRGIAAGALTSANSDDETRAIMDGLHDGRIRLLYMAPERLASGATMALLRRIDVAAIAVDEAHCVSQWGHDFRPDYLRLGDLRRRLDVPLAAFTATADEETRAEIITRLFGDAPPEVFASGFDRPNIHLAFAEKKSPRQQLLRFVDAHRGTPGIVYCATRARTETLARALEKDGHRTLFYHGGMPPDERRFVESRFRRDEDLVVVATVAFGMGVDRADIRWVAHADLPKSVESYYQEIGRAGRDGKPADTLVLYGAEDIRIRRAQIDESMAPAERKTQDHRRLNALLGVAEATRCRRQVLLRYFGEETKPCGNCDLCRWPARLFDGTEAVRKALSAALRTAERYGSGHLIDILTGTRTRRVIEQHHDALPTFGVGGTRSRNAWRAIFRQMMARDLLRPDSERHGALRVTKEALPVLRGKETVLLREDAGAEDKARAPAKGIVAEEDQALFSALRAQRKALAAAASVPAYIVFTDRTLAEMAERRPKDFDAMARIGGVGPKKLARYGEAFLAVINGAATPPHPARLALAGTRDGAVFDRLQRVQADLATGADGIGRPLHCSSALLRRIAERRPDTREALARVPGMDARRVERFGSAFLAILADPEADMEAKDA